jgi:hypothetical protein
LVRAERVPLGVDEATLPGHPRQRVLGQRRLAPRLQDPVLDLLEVVHAAGAHKGVNTPTRAVRRRWPAEPPAVDAPLVLLDVRTDQYATPVTFVQNLNDQPSATW